MMSLMHDVISIPYTSTGKIDTGVIHVLSDTVLVHTWEHSKMHHVISISYTSTGKIDTGVIHLLSDTVLVHTWEHSKEILRDPKIIQCQCFSVDIGLPHHRTG